MPTNLEIEKMKKIVAALAVLCALPVSAAAQEADAPPTETPPAAAPAPHPADQLRPVPHPDLANLDPQVAAQLGKMRDILQAILDESRSDPQALHDTYSELGQLYHAYDFLEAAEVCYLNATRIRPRSFDPIYLRAVLLQQSGRLADAEAVFQTAREQRPNDLAIIVRMGEVYLALNQPEIAIQAFRYALELDPGCAAARAGLGEIALAEGRHQEAVDELEFVLERVPAANRLHYPLALAYRGLGDRDQARQHLAQRGTVGVKPPDPLVEGLQDLKQGERVHLLRGRMAFGAGRYREAAEAFAAAVEALPESARARVNLGTTLGLLGDSEAAKAQYREALKLAPDNPTAHFNLGSLLAREGTATEAVRHLRLAVAVDEDDPGARVELARVLKQSGQPAEARQHYARAVELDPLNEEARLGEAVILVDEGRYAEARERLEEAVTTLPEQGRIALALARLLAGSPDLAIRNGELAVNLAQRVYAAAPTAAHAATVAMALAELGRCDEAASWQRQLVAAAEEAGAAEQARQLAETLRRYEGETCRPGSG